MDPNTNISGQKLSIAFPINKAYSSKYYALIIEDANGTIHYWNFDGSYDGWAIPSDRCAQTKTPMN